MPKKDRNETPNLSRTEALILEVLFGNGAREMYGLEIVETSDGRVTRGSVYVLLSRMEDKGFVESRSEPAPEHAGGLARVLYKPTGLGQRAFRAWAAARKVWNMGVVHAP